MAGITNYSIVQSVPLATLLAAITGNGITIVPASGSLVGDARAFGLLTSPKDLTQSPNFLEIPIIGGAAAAMGTSVVVLSTGQAVTLRGPNNSPSAGTDFGKAGDAQLAALIGTVVGNTHDAAILTFQFTSTGTTITLPYLFGSEEYTEFVYDVYTDVMGIWLDGVNKALVPGTLATPIAINTIHHGDPDGTPPFSNPQFYKNNPVTTGPINCQLDGFVGLTSTVPFTITATVVPGQVYTLRIGICDVADGFYDSAVFLGKLTATGILGVGWPTDLPVPPGNPGGTGCTAVVAAGDGNSGGSGCSAVLPTTAVTY